MAQSKPSSEEFLAQLAGLRPELHRYCSRLTGSVFDGEDIVQSTLVGAVEEAGRLEHVHHFRAWIFRLAHNRAVDHLRAKVRRRAEPLEVADALADESRPSPADELAQREATALAIERFLLLPVGPRSVVILKDVLGHSLADIAAMLDLSLAAVKSALHRGRRHLQKLNAALGSSPPPPRTISPELTRYVALFNARDWDPLRALLTEEVRLDQTTHPELRGKRVVGNFFTRYAAAHDWHLATAWVEGREVAAVLPSASATHPSYFMEIRWHQGEIIAIRDFRYARYVTESATITGA